MTEGIFAGTSDIMDIPIEMSEFLVESLRISKWRQDVILPRVPFVWMDVMLYIQ